MDQREGDGQIQRTELGLSLVSGSPTNHTLTNIDTIQQFLDITFHLNRLGEEVWEVRM
jgi:RNA 3'-terminal phosphate cyclase